MRLFLRVKIVQKHFRLSKKSDVPFSKANKYTIIIVIHLGNKSYEEFPNDLEKVPVKLEGIVGIPIDIPSTFKFSSSLIITLKRANLSFKPGPGPADSSGSASKSLNPFSNCPQSLRKVR